MSSRSESPSITHFFKAQRKRPRAGKEDVVGGITPTSKKLLLETGMVSAPSGGYAEEDEGPVKPVLVVKDTAVVKSEVLERKKKKATTSKTSSKQKSSTVQSSGGGGGTQKILDFGKSAAPSDPETLVNEKETEKNDTVDKAADLAPVDADTGEDVSSERSESPVKFLKVGALSPTKRKKMTTEQVAKLLRKKTKLSELKKTLDGINQCAQKISDFRQTVADSNAKLSPAKAPEQDAANGASSSLSSPSKRTMSNLKQGISPAQFYSPTADRIRADLDRLSASKVTSPSKLVSINNKIKKRLFEEQASPNEEDRTAAVPAYQRFHSLAQKTPAEVGSGEEVDLPLPYQFKILKELFIAVETVVGIMKSRKETIIFPKIKAGVLELFRKTSLREKHLAQMVTILPGCYSFELEKVGTTTHIKLIVEDLLPSVVCARRKEFHSALTKICLQHHQKFLLGLAPPIVVPADKQITRWHPQFKIDGIPDIVPEENILPTKPTPDKISTAREVMAKAQNILQSGNPRMINAVKNMLDKTDEDSVKNSTPAIVKPDPLSAAKVKALKGVSQSLLEKIRNREREKLLNEMTRSPAESKKLQMTKRLPSFIKIIRNMMVADKKVALPMDVVVDRVSHSVQSLSKMDTETHVRLLATLLPKWIKIHKISHSDMEYVKIEKNTDINNLLEEVNDIIKKLSS